MSLQEVKDIAGRCVHYAMCRIDFLGTGVCASGGRSGFVSHYPQGRMEIAYALAEGIVPVTEAVVDVAQSCTLCGRCDKQCYFIRQLRPMKVMKALKEHVEAHLAKGLPAVKTPEDETLRRLRGVVGREWATNDPAILATYSVDRQRLLERRMPRYVVLPGSTEEVAAIVRTANACQLRWTARGHGSSTGGAALGDGIIIDLTRMKHLEVNPGTWTATIGPGVTAFDLQKEAVRHGMRAAVVEPAACVCANIVNSNMHSLFSYAYGLGADHYVDGQFVDGHGEIFTLNDKRAPNPFAFDANGATPLGICTQLTLRLYPMTDDESAVIIPFAELREAVTLARELGRRRIGFAAAVLSANYVSAFGSPTHQMADDFMRLVRETLGIEYGLLVLGDRYAMAAVRDLSPVTIDEETIRAMTLAMPQLSGDEGLALLTELAGDRKPYEVVFREGMAPLIQAALSSSPDSLTAAVDEDMKEFYKEVYSRPEMTSLVWLNMFRILSARIGRGRGYQGKVVFLSLDDPDAICEVCGRLGSIADRHGLKHGFGCLIPVDFGKRAVLEYDYYHDHTDPQEIERAKAASREANEMLARDMPRLHGRLARVMAHQGHCRKESLLYLHV